MKNFNSIDEQNSTNSAVTDFLNSLDTDISNPIDLNVVQNDKNLENSELANNNAKNDNTEVTALVVQKPNSLFVAQTMFRKSIKISIKSFLISLSLGFLNLFF